MQPHKPTQTKAEQDTKKQGVNKDSQLPGQAVSSRDAAASLTLVPPLMLLLTAGTLLPWGGMLLPAAAAWGT
jgi:hypothetical protein